MCGDGIILMWNVKSVKLYLNQNTLIKSAVLVSVKKRQGQSLLENTKTAIKVKRLLKCGIKAHRELRQKRNTEVSQRQNYWLLSVLKNIKLEIQKNARLGIESMGIEAEATTQDILTEKLLKRSLNLLEISVFIVDVLRGLSQTISFHCQKAGQISLIIYNRFARAVTPQKEIKYAI